MPVGSSSAEDLASSDEIKVFKDEGEDEKRASADLTDLKSSLITESDQEKSSSFAGTKSSTTTNNQTQPTTSQQNGNNGNGVGQRPETTSTFGNKPFASTLGYSPFGYPLHPHSPYHHNGTTLGQMANKMASMVGASHHPPHHPHHPHHHSGSSAAAAAAALPFMMPNMERLPQPPPAHMGIPPVHIETKAVSISAWMDISNIARNPLYNLSGHGQYSHSVLSDLTQQFQWPNPAMYHQLQSAAFPNPYPSLTSVSSATFPSFRTPPIMPHPSLSGHSFPHPGFLPSTTTSNDNMNNIVNNSSTTTTSNSKSSNRLSNGKNPFSFNGTSTNSSSVVSPSNANRLTSLNSGSSSSSSSSSSSANNRRNGSSSENHFNNNNNNKQTVNRNQISNSSSPCLNGTSKLVKNSQNPTINGQTIPSTTTTVQQQQEDRDQQNNSKMHIKKPLNAFMIYMKEMRAKVIAESTLKESAAINQILGKKWHDLSRAEQEKYYDKAKKARELHMELHPGWTAKDNYAINGKRKKKKRERNADGERGALKKCRARYGLDQQNHWCKPCRRKKKCIRYLEAVRAVQQAAASNGKNRSENESDNFGSVSSVEARTPESKSANESDHDNTMNISSTDLSLSSPSNSEYQHFVNTFNHFSSASAAINSPTNAHHHLNLNVPPSTTNGNHLPSPSSLFYAHHHHHHHNSSSNHSLSSPLGSRMSSLLTPNSPLTSSISSSFSSSSPSSTLVMPPTTTTTATTTANTTNHQNQVPPRNSPFSIEQLARPHCPQSHRSSPLSSTSNHVAVITQLPTPPSSTDSNTPAMLSVA